MTLLLSSPASTIPVPRLDQSLSLSWTPPGWKGRPWSSCCGCWCLSSRGSEGGESSGDSSTTATWPRREAKAKRLLDHWATGSRLRGGRGVHLPVKWLDAVLRNNEAGVYWVVKRPHTRSWVVERLSTGTNIGEGLHTGPWGDCKGLVGRSRLSRANRGKGGRRPAWSWLTRSHGGKGGRLRTVGGRNLIHLERPILGTVLTLKL